MVKGKTIHVSWWSLQSIDWLIDCSTGCLIYASGRRLIDWLFYWMLDLCFGPSVDWLIDWFANVEFGFLCLRTRGDVKLTDGANVMMMGSADEIPIKPPAAKTDDKDQINEDVRLESMDGFSKVPCHDVLKFRFLQENLPLGLVNLGNTCYLNATLQCFRAVPELRDSLKRFVWII
jgi:Ubiquitin carboxyl-terminal hydrolase